MQRIILFNITNTFFFAWGKSGKSLPGKLTNNLYEYKTFFCSFDLEICNLSF